MNVKLNKSSEWWQFDSPIGEPEIKWDLLRWNYNYTEKERNTYLIERVEEDEKVIWFGQGTNWIRENGEWSYLGVDKSVEPTKVYRDDIDGSISGALYPEGRDKWYICSEPIYEKLRREYNG